MQPKYDRVRLNGYDFPSGTEADLPPELRIDCYDGETGLFLIQTKGPITAEWEQTLHSAGNVIGYFPQNTFLVVAKNEAYRGGALAALAGVQHVSVYQPAYKIRPSLLENEGEVDVIVQLDASQDLKRIHRMIEDVVDHPIFLPEFGPIRYLSLTLSLQQMRSLAREPEVLFIEKKPDIHLSGERQAMVTAGLIDAATGTRPQAVGAPPNRNGYPEWLESKGFCGPSEYPSPSGCTIKYWTKVAVIDTGLDQNQCTTSHATCDDGANWITGSPLRHQDLNHDSCPDAQSCVPAQNQFYCITVDDGQGGKENVCENSNGDYVYDDRPIDNSVLIQHGSNVASIVAGNPLSGASSTPNDNLGYYNGMGVAPAAQILVASFLDADDQAVPSFGVDDYSTLLRSVHEAGARFANNSWNVQNDEWADKDYTSFSQLMDQHVRDARGDFNNADHDMTIVFSAGNNEPNFGVFTYAPANAKNIISVGASLGWLQDGGTTNHPCASETSDEQVIGDIWVDSARGVRNEPERFKPDLVAPGPLCATGKAAWDSQTGYKCFSGTSSAAPVVTGAAVLLEAWYVETQSAFPTPAMLKAILVAHADDLAGGTDFLPNPDETLGHRPSMPQGWGRVNIGKAIQDEVDTVFIDEDHESTPTRRFVAGSGSFWSDNFEVDGDHDGEDDWVLVVLAYTDKYGQTSASESLVNDLDLMVIDQFMGGPIYIGNKFTLESGEWVSSGFTYPQIPQLFYDHHNNVELVIMRASDVIGGNFSVKVSARTLSEKAVPGLDGLSANQDFALYVFGAHLL